MTDEELIARLRLYGSKFHHEFGHNDAADRIEALTKERDQLGREVNMARYGQPDFAWSIHKEAMADLEGKLAKAVEGQKVNTLEQILEERGAVFGAMVDAAEDAAGKDVSFNVVVGRALRAAIAEIKGESHE